MIKFPLSASSWERETNENADEIKDPSKLQVPFIFPAKNLLTNNCVLENKRGNNWTN